MINPIFSELQYLRTEQINPNTINIDLVSTPEILELINNEDLKVAQAVRDEIHNIALAVDLITHSFKNSGRLFYVGAGTSGRIGIVDAAECPPTYGTNPDLVQGIIAGGKNAVFQAVEGAEDNLDDGKKVIIDYGITENDVVCGIAASGRTPFVAGAIRQANELNAKTILVTTASKEFINQINIQTDVLIAVDVGPEVIAGSTRMKSGTAQKLVLNMLTTSAMVKLGKTFGNVMVDLQLTNQKLSERAKKIIMSITNVDYETAKKYLELSNGNVKTAIVMIITNSNYEEAIQLLNKADGFIRKIE